MQNKNSVKIHIILIIKLKCELVFNGNKKNE